MFTQCIIQYAAYTNVFYFNNNQYIQSMLFIKYVLHYVTLFGRGTFPIWNKMDRKPE